MHPSLLVHALGELLNQFRRCASFKVYSKRGI